MRFLVVFGYLAVLDRIVQIDAEMEARCQIAHHELRLHTHADSPAIFLGSPFEIGLPEIRNAVDIRPVIEDINTASETENTMRPPISSHLHLGAEEGLLISIIHLPRCTRKGELYLAFIRP